MKNNTSDKTYTKRLQTLQNKKWKEVLDVQRPYRWNIKRLKLGKTLDVGCGIGRNLEALSRNSVGLDHNKHSIQITKNKGLIAFTPNEFKKSKEAKKNSFDSLLFAHVIEHMTFKEAKEIILEYLPYIKSPGKVVIICPQGKGFNSDETHITFFTKEMIEELLNDLGLSVARSYSFPFIKKIGDFFTYNETVVIAKKR